MFRTEFFGTQAVYRIRIVSEAIARAYARPGHEIIAYDAPIITREEHEAAMDRAREINATLRERLNEAERKLLALPAGQTGEVSHGAIGATISGVADEDDKKD
jgi:hypothetical protein